MSRTHRSTAAAHRYDTAEHRYRPALARAARPGSGAVRRCFGPVRYGAAVVAGLVVLGLVGCDSTADPDRAEPTISATPGPATDCPQPGVRILDAGSDAATGFRAQVLRLTNCGDVVFTVDGYPRLQLLDADGQTLEVTVTHGAQSIPDPGPSAIDLAPGESVTTTLSWHNTVESGEPVTAESLLVAPGPDAPEQPVGLAAPVDLGTTGTIDVTAWAPDTTR